MRFNLDQAFDRVVEVLLSQGWEPGAVHELGLWVLKLDCVSPLADECVVYPTSEELEGGNSRFSPGEFNALFWRLRNQAVQPFMAKPRKRNTSSAALVDHGYIFVCMGRHEKLREAALEIYARLHTEALAA